MCPYMQMSLLTVLFMIELLAFSSSDLSRPPKSIYIVNIIITAVSAVQVILAIQSWLLIEKDTVCFQCVSTKSLNMATTELAARKGEAQIAAILMHRIRHFYPF